MHNQTKRKYLDKLKETVQCFGKAPFSKKDILLRRSPVRKRKLSDKLADVVAEIQACAIQIALLIIFLVGLVTIVAKLL